MKMIILIVIFVFLVIPNVFAACNENQIDMNTAPLNDLDQIYGIGPAKAQAIIDARPFENLDDLIRTKGIGEITLENIKNQGLACIGNDEKENEDNDEKEKDVIKEESNEIIENEDNTPISEETILLEDPIEKIQIKNPEIIKLNSQTIKSQDDNENLKKSKKNLYFKYGFVTLSIIIGFLLLLRKNRIDKNEFEI